MLAVKLKIDEERTSLASSCWLLKWKKCLADQNGKKMEVEMGLGYCISLFTVMDFYILGMFVIL